MNKLSKEAVKFIIIGIFGTAVNYGVFYTIYKFIGVNYTISSAIGFIAGVFAGFPFNKNWTFQSDKNTRKVIIPYFTIYLMSLGISIALLNIQVKLLNINPLIANVVCICVTTVTNFIGTKLFVFKNTN